jgi:hypothetical protein
MPGTRSISTRSRNRSWRGNASPMRRRRRRKHEARHRSDLKSSGRRRSTPRSRGPLSKSAYRVGWGSSCPASRDGNFYPKRGGVPLMAHPLPLNWVPYHIMGSVVHYSKVEPFRGSITHRRATETMPGTRSISTRSRNRSWRGNASPMRRRRRRKHELKPLRLESDRQTTDIDRPYFITGPSRQSCYICSYFVTSTGNVIPSAAVLGFVGSTSDTVPPVLAQSQRR